MRSDNLKDMAYTIEMPEMWKNRSDGTRAKKTDGGGRVALEILRAKLLSRAKKLMK